MQKEAWIALKGKGFFIWKVRECENGDSQAIATQAVQAGLTHLIVKIADGTYSYNVEPSGVDLVLPIVQACHAQGVLVYGWQYIYDEDRVGEANKAIQRIHQTKVDGFVIDVEKEFKESGKDQAARKYMDRLRAAFSACAPWWPGP